MWVPISVEMEINYSIILYQNKFKKHNCFTILRGLGPNGSRIKYPRKKHYFQISCADFVLLLPLGILTLMILQTCFSRHHGGKLRTSLIPLIHHSTIALKWVLNWSPIMPRDASLSDSRCKFSQSGCFINKNPSFLYLRRYIMRLEGHFLRLTSIF